MVMRKAERQKQKGKRERTVPQEDRQSARRSSERKKAAARDLEEVLVERQITRLRLTKEQHIGEVRHHVRVTLAGVMGETLDELCASRNEDSLREVDGYLILRLIERRASAPRGVWWKSGSKQA